MFYIMLGFYLFMAICNSLGLFLGGGAILKFNRGFIRARPTMVAIFIMISFAIFILLYTGKISGYIEYDKITISFITFLTIIIIAGFDYKKIGEGIFENGVVFRGMYIPRKSIIKYSVTNNPHNDSFLLTLTTQYNYLLGETHYTIDSKYKTDLEKALSDYIIN